MANPNIVGLTSILGQTNGVTAGTSSANLVTNGSGTGQVYKVNSITFCNTADDDRAITCRVVLDGTTRYLTSALVIPGRATIDVISKPIYLNENCSINVVADQGTDVSCLASFEKIG